MRSVTWLLINVFVLAGCVNAADAPQEPVPLILDTDMGNDIDDAMALATIHALADRQECELLAVTITKDHPQAAAFVDLVNTFYGRADVPIGVVRDGVVGDPSSFTMLADRRDGAVPRYPHDLVSGAAAPEAVSLLRKTLAAAADKRVVIVQVGFSTNLARLMDSVGGPASPLDGMQLIRRKVARLEIMAGSFQQIGDQPRYVAYNVKQEIANASRILEGWPTPLVVSGFEIGTALPYPARSFQHDFRYVQHHPIAEAYELFSPTPQARPTWDLTSVLHAVRPQRGYFDLSVPGRIQVHADGYTEFIRDSGGNRRYLVLQPAQRDKTLETLVHLVSQPPAR